MTPRERFEHNHDNQRAEIMHETADEYNHRKHPGSLEHRESSGDSKPGAHVANQVYKAKKEEAAATVDFGINSYAWDDWYHDQIQTHCRGSDHKTLTPGLLERKCLKNNHCCAFNAQCQSGCCAKRGFICKQFDNNEFDVNTESKFEYCERWD